MFKKIISGALTLGMLISISPVSATTFEKGLIWDVPESNGLYTHIDKLVNNGVLTVYSDGSFRPDEAVSREKAARYIYNALLKAGRTDLVDAKTSENKLLAVRPFPDVMSNDFYAFYINEIKDLGIMKGYENGNFGPNNSLSRGEMLAILEKARLKSDTEFKIPDYKNYPSLIMSSHRFSDVKASDTFFDYIYTALDNNYIATNNTYRANDEVSKAELAKLLNNIVFTPITSTKNDEVSDNTDNNTSTGLFYKGNNIKLEGDVKYSGSKIDFTVNTSKISPQIPYLDKKFLKVMVNGITLPVFKITLIESNKKFATYGIYVSKGIDVDSLVEVEYTDSFTKLTGSSEIDNKIKEEITISDENTDEGDVDLGVDDLEEGNNTLKELDSLDVSLLYSGELINPVSELKIDDIEKSFELQLSISGIEGKIPYLKKEDISIKDKNDNILSVDKIVLISSTDNLFKYGVYVNAIIDKNLNYLLTYEDAKLKVEASYITSGTEEDTTEEDTTEEDTTEEDNTDTNTGSDTGVLEIQLSNETPNGGTIPSNIAGVKIATYELTAQGGDVEVNSLTIKRTGFADEDTLTGLALFNDKGRISKVRDDNQGDNDDEAELSFLDDLVIKSGETKKVSIYVAVGPSSDTAGEDFAIKMIAVDSDAKTLNLKNEDGNIFEISSSEAPMLKLKKGTNVSDPQLGDKAIEISKFEIEGDNTNSIYVKSITFKAINNDMEDDLKNLVLKNNGNVIATSEGINNKYVTFNFTEDFKVGSSRIERFTIEADIVGGAGDKIGFYFEENLDVQGYYNGQYPIQSNITLLDSEAEANQIEINAGELTLVDIDPTYDEIKEDRNNVSLGELKISNASGEDIELQEFGIKITLTPGNSYISGNVAGSLTLAELFEKVELVNKDTGSRYDLSLPTGSETDFVFSDDDLNIDLKDGDTTFTINVDTGRNIEDFNTASVELSLTTGNLSNTTGGFYAVEKTDDKAINDITPSSLSWGKIDGSESSAKASLIPLSNITKVRGANDVTALEFELDTDPSSKINVEEMIVDLKANGINATSQEISSVSLYKNSISTNNLLDSVSGSQLQTGKAYFDGFKVMINANDKEKFIIALSIVDSNDAVTNSPITSTLTDITMFDEDQNDVDYLEGNLVSGRSINVVDSGILKLEQDVNNDVNEYNKNILAGELKEKIFSIDIQADNENIDIEEVAFLVNKDLTKSLKSASLYLGSTLIATNSYTDISLSGTDTLISFPSLNTLIIPQETTELTLAINTNTIGYEKVGETIKDAKVTEVKIVKAEGKDSRFNLTPSTLTITSSKEFSILPVITTPSLVSDLSSGQSKIRISIDTGDNTIPTSNTSPQIKLKDLIFTELSSSSDGYIIYKEGESSRRGVIDNTGKVTLSATQVNAEAEVTEINVTTAATTSGNVQFVFNDQTFDITLSVSDINTNASEIATAIDSSSKYSASAVGGLITVTAVDSEDQVIATYIDTGTTGLVDTITVTTEGKDFVPYANMSGSDLTISSNTTYVIVPNGTVDKTYSLSLTREGIVYDIVKSDGTVIEADINTATQTELNLGVKSY